MLNDHQIYKYNEQTRLIWDGIWAPGRRRQLPSSHDGHRDSAFAFEQEDKILRLLYYFLPLPRTGIFFSQITHPSPEPNT